MESKESTKSAEVALCVQIIEWPELIESKTTKSEPIESKTAEFKIRKIESKYVESGQTNSKHVIDESRLS